MSYAGDIWCSSCGMLRYLLAFLGLVASALDYMLRFNLSVTIVAMMNTTHTQDVNTTSYACPAAFNASRDAQKTTVEREDKDAVLTPC